MLEVGLDHLLVPDIVLINPRALRFASLSIQSLITDIRTLLLYSPNLFFHCKIIFQYMKQSVKVIEWKAVGISGSSVFSSGKV